MTYDVFISHSSEDKIVADATYAFLERHGIRCWITPRDILPGPDWGGSIFEAVREARVMLLIFSGSANTSPQIKREVKQATNAAVPGILIRIEDVQPKGDLKIFVDTALSFDAVILSFEHQFEKLEAAIREILGRTTAMAPREKIVVLKPPIIVKDLALKLGLKPYQVIHDLMEMNVFTSAGQALEEEVARKLCTKLGFALEIEKREKTPSPVHAPFKIPAQPMPLLQPPLTAPNLAEAEKMVARSLDLKRKGHLFDAADVMEEAFTKSPQLRNKYGRHVKLWRRGIGMGERPKSERVATDKVEFSVFSTQQIVPGLQFVLDFWAHLPNQKEEVQKQAKSMHRDAPVGFKGAVPLARNTLLSIVLDLPKFEIADPVQHFTWLGDPTNVSFILNAPESLGSGRYVGKATVGVGGLPLCQVVVELSVHEKTAPPSAHEANLVSHVRHYRSIFSSYSSKDRDEVLGRLQGVRLINPYVDIFLDVASLRSGRWKEQLEQHIVSKDAFFLFWSAHAAESEWVEREWKLALERRGLDYIVPVPLENPVLSPPPPELKELHFNDGYLAYRNA